MDNPATSETSLLPVAVVGDVYQLLWIGDGPIAPLVKRHGIKVGSLLYATPIGVDVLLRQALEALNAAYPAIPPHAMWPERFRAGRPAEDCYINTMVRKAAEAVSQHLTKE